MHLPPTTAPLIMIGPGTGCAAFRSFIQHRAYLKSIGETVGPTIFFFGCRKKAMDYLHGEEWEQYLEDGSLTYYKCAFSRDQEKKVYIQHKIEEQVTGRILFSMMRRQGYIYVSGNAKRMPDDIQRAIRNVVMREANTTQENADLFLKRLVAQGKYITETW